jgi:hypothetical protein
MTGFDEEWELDPDNDEILDLIAGIASGFYGLTEGGINADEFSTTEAPRPQRKSDLSPDPNVVHEPERISSSAGARRAAVMVKAR